MKFLVLPAVTALLATTAAQLTEADIRGYETTGLVYTGPVTPGGADIEINGTDARDIYEQIMQHNPKFNPMDWEHVRVANSDAAQLEARTITGVQCNANPKPYNIPGLASSLKESIAYLNRLPGRCGTGGGHQAARLTCSWDSALWFVNNNNVAWNADCTWVAGMGQRIYDQCRTGLGIEATGQVWDNENYVVLSCSTFC